MKEKKIKLCKKILPASLIFMFVAALFAMPADAAGLSAVGPIDPVNHFPQFYRDASGVAIQPCLAGANGFADPGCVLIGVTGFDPTLPLVFPTNFPQETFYWVATAKDKSGTGKIIFRMALEGAFSTLQPLGAVVDGNQITFLRVNLRPLTGLVAGQTYTFIYPFGTFQVKADSNGAIPKQTRFQDGCVGSPCDFASLLPATTTHISTFLSGVSPATNAIPPFLDPNIYLGTGALLAATGQTITTGPNGATLTIIGPNINPFNVGGTGINTLVLDQWFVAGKKLLSGLTLLVDGAATSTRTTTINTFATYLLTVTNTGNGVDTFNIAVTAPAGAIASTNVSSITLGAGQSGFVQLNVISAAPGSYAVSVAATSVANPTVSATVTTTTTVSAGVSPSIAMIKQTDPPFTFTTPALGVTWTSSLGTVGTIDPITGVFTPVGPGSTTITATTTDPVTGLPVTVGTALAIVGVNRSTSAPLVAGDNLISFSVQSDPVFTASKLLQLVSAENPGVSGTKVTKWDAAAQAFVSYDPVVGLNDFPIVGGQSYFVRASVPVPAPVPAPSISIVGTVVGIS